MSDHENNTENHSLATKLLWRLLNLSSDVRKKETTEVVLLFLTVFLALISYYVVKTVREPLILASGGAEMKSYAAAVQALVLVGFIPAYGWLSDQFSRLNLIIGVTLFYGLCMELFYVLAQFNVPYLGFAFYVWVGIFSLSIIAQFWSYANDLYDEGSGQRLFPVIAIGATAGAPLGSAISGYLSDMGISPYMMLHIAAILLLLHLGLYFLVERRVVYTVSSKEECEEPCGEGDSALKLILGNKYLWLIAGFLILLNLVNTTGEYILSEYVVSRAEEVVSESSSMTKEAFIGSFYGRFYTIVNIATIIIQTFLVSRLCKWFGLPGVLFALPMVSLTTYSLAAVGVGFSIFRYSKMAENSTDYSVMNTAKALIWLPTTKEEQYKAKQAIDTFFVRAGDVLSAGLVFVGTQWLALSPSGFGMVNLGLIGVWIAVGVLLIQRFRQIADLDDLDTEEVVSS
jgi:AAA family ATP:ADP antiporter